ncbi:hypothetical protein V1509DRAFT_610006 [Lipomyces kononenkoae]
MEGGSGKRIDVKYDEVDPSTLKSSFRAWTDSKADLEHVWAGASWKYQRDDLKIFKAVSKMARPAGPVGMAMSGLILKMEDDYTQFLGWNTKMQPSGIIRALVDFDAYLSSIEREVPEVPDSESQKDDLFTQRVLAELRDSSSEKSRTLYSQDVDGILQCKGRLYIQQKRALIEELLKLHHGDQLAGQMTML